MKSQSLLVMVMILLAGSWTGLARAELPVSEIVALHFHPDTAIEARKRSLALAAWLEGPVVDPGQWQEQIGAHTLTLERRAERVDPSWAVTSDGMFAWLVHARDRNLPASVPGTMMPSLHRVSDLLRRDDAVGRLARLYPEAAYRAPELWPALLEHLNAAEIEIQDEEPTDLPSATERIVQFWQPLLDRFEDSQPEDQAHARRQADRALALSRLETGQERRLNIAELLLDEARLFEQRERVLAMVWTLMEGLILLSAGDSGQDLAVNYKTFLDELTEEDPLRWRAVDAGLPVVFALMHDAAAYLAEAEPGTLAAVSELADAYARLALFASDAAFYLDQPVREDIRRAISQCNPDPLLVGPLPREVYDACLNELTGLLTNALDREELTGDGSGPFAAEFLRREMGLVSWQRASYLDGHLNWHLGAACQPVEWVNVLEWSILMQYLVYWVPQRPVFFGTIRWQDAVDAIAERGRTLEQGRADWMDCITGLGTVRNDPVQRLLERHERAQANLAGAMQDATSQFYDSVTRSGADIDLDAGTDQVTAYRPDGLMVTPCEGAATCGARIELPASRALLGLFPNAYLLADQTGLGELRLCYENVRWVDREQRSARGSDDRVANYHGRLSFELTGSFLRDAEEEVVFRQRLTSGERRHYLFAAADESILDLECPTSLAGESVASHLPERRMGLVPNRLTYFVSLPTTAESQLSANWDRGSEWRDWFVTGRQLESLVEQDDESEALAMVVRAHLSELITRRERQLSASLLNPPGPETTDPLTRAMTEVSDNTTLLRRVIELHYPRLLRHHDDIRSALSGDGGLLTRERVRQMRDAGAPMASIPLQGRERMERLREHWLALPTTLRESGHPSPEFDYGQEKLELLKWLNRSWPAPFESPPDRQSTD
jgi:hypothetical protein